MQLFCLPDTILRRYILAKYTETLSKFYFRAGKKRVWRLFLPPPEAAFIFDRELIINPKIKM